MSGKKREIRTVVVQKWEESEAGFGTRPDGFSLHLSEADREAFIKDYWDSMPDETQPEYSRPDGTPYLADVDTKTYAQVQASKNGIRDFGTMPGSGGTNGWIPMKEPPGPKCRKCNDTGIIDTGNNDLPCECSAGDTALFNIAGFDRPISGAALKSTRRFG